MKKQGDRWKNTHTYRSQDYVSIISSDINNNNMESLYKLNVHEERIQSSKLLHHQRWSPRRTLVKNVYVIYGNL